MSSTHRSDLVAEEPYGAGGSPRQTEEHRRLWEAVADKLETDPSLLQIPLDNISRWSSSGLAGQFHLEKWRTMIRAAQRSPADLFLLTAFLRSDSDESLHTKGFDPFPGVLSTSELDEIQCISAH